MRNTARILALYVIDDLLSMGIPLFGRSKCEEVFLGINAVRHGGRCRKDETAFDTGKFQRSASGSFPKSSLLCTFSLRENRFNVTGFVAAPGSLKNVYRVHHDRSTRDTSTIKQTLEAIPAGQLPSGPKASVAGYGWYRGYYMARIEITPFYSNPSTHTALFAQSIDLQLNKVRTKTAAASPQVKVNDPHFDRILRELIVNFDEAQPYQMPAVNDTTGGWFNTTAKYIKLAIPNDGIYRITQSQLDSVYPSIVSIDPRTFQVFDHGKEIPIFVSGDSDGVFNPGDYLEFPALRNYTGKQRIITTALADEY